MWCVLGISLIFLAQEIPLEGARTYTSEHYEVTSDCDADTVRRYIDILEAARPGWKDLFGDLRRDPEGKARVVIYGDWKMFMELLGHPGTPGFYAPEPCFTFPAGTLIAYGGDAADPRRIRNVLLEMGTHQFMDRQVPGASNVPFWLRAGLGTGAGPFLRDHLFNLRKAIRRDFVVSLKTLLVLPQHVFARGHYTFAWSLVDWMLNADGGDHRDLFRYIWNLARDHRLDPGEVVDLFEAETGLGMEEFQERVWKPYVLDMKVPSAGAVEKETFVSQLMGFSLERPADDWAWILEGLELDHPLTLRHEDGKARMEVRVWTAFGPSTRAEIRQEEMDRQTIEAAEDRIWSDHNADEPESTDIEADGRPAVQFEFKSRPSITGFEDDDVEEVESGNHIWIVIPTRFRTYEIRLAVPPGKAEEYLPDLQKVVKSFRFLGEEGHGP